MALVKLNLSGHKNALLEEQGFIFPGSLQVDLADAKLPEKVTEFLRPLVSSEDIVVIAAPGLAPLALIVTAVIHGLTGSFPVIVPPIRGEDGFKPGAQLSLQEVRNDVARKAREDVYDITL